MIICVVLHVRCDVCEDSVEISVKANSNLIRVDAILDGKGWDTRKGHICDECYDNLDYRG